MTRQIGIDVVAENKADAGINAAASSLKRLDGAVGSSIIKANAIGQAFRVASQALRVMEQAVGSSIEQALAHRSALDQTAQSVAKWKKESDDLKTSIGESLLPAVNVLSTAGAQLAKDISTWAAANREVIGTGIIEWAGTLANILVTSVSTAILACSRAAYGLNVAWLNVRGTIAELTGDEKGAGAIADALDDAARADREFEAQVEKTTDMIADYVGNAQVQAFRDLGKEVKKTATGIAIDWQAVDTALDASAAKVDADNAQRQKERLAAWQKEGIDRIDYATAVSQREAQIAQYYAEEEYRSAKAASDKEKEVAKQTGEYKKAMGSAVAGAISGALVSSLTEAINGTKSLDEAFADFASNAANAVFQSAMNIAISHAIEAATGAASSQAAIPIIGPALGIAAMAAMFAAVSGFIKSNQPKKMAMGGIVSGGMPGQDSVPALLMPGEVVLNNNQANMLRGALREGGAGGVGGGGNIVINAGLMGMPSRPQTEQWMRDAVVVGLGRLKKKGMFQ